MKTFLLRMLAVLTACMLASAPALAAPLDAAFSAFWDENADVRFALSAQLDALVPYGDETVALFNTALRHVSVAAQVTGDTTEMDICVAGDPVVSLTETVTDEGSTLVTPLLPNRTLTSSGSVMDKLGLGKAEEPFDFFRAVAEAQSCYQQLTDAILPYAEQKAANYKISGVGTSKWSRIARLTPEQGKELAPLIAQVLGCGMDEAYRKELQNMTFSKGFIVGLYQTEEGGEDLAVYIKGGVTFADGGYRTLSYQWAFADKQDGVRVDTYKFEMNRSKGAKDDREISASYERQTGESVKLEGESKCLIRSPETGESVTTTITHDLTGAENGSERSLNGSVTTTVRTAKGDSASTVTTAISPSLTLLSSEGSGVMSGKVEIERKKGGKTVEMSAVITFDEEPAERFAEAADTGMLFIVIDDGDQPQSSLMQNMDVPAQDDPDDYLVGKPPAGYESHTAPKQQTVVDMDHLTAEESAALMDELAQNLAGKLIIAIARLPKEDSVLLQDSLSASDFDALLKLVEGL